MSFSVDARSASTIEYAGRPMPILAGLHERPVGFAIAELTVPAGFPGPPPHAHDLFDEAIYVLDGSVVVTGDEEPLQIGVGELFVAPRTERHGFSNPSDTVARVLGIWGPSRPAMEFMTAIGAALPAQGPPNLETLRSVYEAHRSRLLP
jgi:mannose-6-phosphate isomerase-like protein (cupin superfamily)